MTRQQVPLLRAAIVALVLVALLTQVLVVPRVAAGYADAYPEVARLQRPYVAVVVLGIVGFEAALFAAWRVLSAAISVDSSPRRVKRWADALAWSLCFMATVFGGLCIHAGFVENVGGPAMLFGLLVSLAVAPAAVALRHRAVGFSLDRGVDQLRPAH